MPYKDPIKAREYKRQWTRVHREGERERKARWMRDNPEKVRARNAEQRAKAKKRRETDPEFDFAWKAKRRAIYWRSRERRLEKARARYYSDEAHRRRVIERTRAWRQANKPSQRRRLPVWLAGSVPTVKIASTRLHLADRAA